MKYKIQEVSDGGFEYPRGWLLPENPDSELIGRYPELVKVPYRPLLVETEKYRVLLDTGAGPLAAGTGQLSRSMEDAGVAPDTIDVLILSHAHADHIGGLTGESGRSTFPNARIIISEREHDFWLNSGFRTRLGSGSVYGNSHLESLISEWIDKHLVPVQEQLEFVRSETEVVPGITVLPAPGHTPGHLAVMISSGEEALLYAGDAFTLPEHISHPEWTSVFDLDAAQTIATRNALLDRADFERCRMVHYHIGQIGRVIRNGNRFNWEEEAAPQRV